MTMHQHRFPFPSVSLLLGGCVCVFFSTVNAWFLSACIQNNETTFSTLLTFLSASNLLQCIVLAPSSYFWRCNSFFFSWNWFKFQFRLNAWLPMMTERSREFCMKEKKNPSPRIKRVEKMNVARSAMKKAKKKQQHQRKKKSTNCW